MADHTPNNPNPHAEQPTQLPEGLSEAARVRAQADGEIAGAQSDAQGVAFERELRQAVSRAMSEPQAAPAGLRDKILARFDEEAAQAPIAFAEHKAAQKPKAGGSSLLSGLFPRLAAVAAVLALSASAVYFGTRNLGSAQPGQIAGNSDINIQAVSSQLQFVQREHDRCSDVTSGNFTSKIVATDIDEARAFAESRLGCGGARLGEAIERMSGSGYEFIGVGGCAVPGGGKSVHALFAPAQGSNSLHPVSLFLLESPGAGCRDAKPGVCYSCPNAEKKGKPSMLWRDNDLIVFIHADSERSVDVARDACLAPDSVESL